ncbi:MAG: tetratricopeptide repeat protein [Candidatus Obscuribacterales bacterium]|nr:tetratricopeptide repeat protein [Candidatus Obscuribacterales bacterium]
MADATTNPPGGWHAPHHPWLLGSHGGKKKPLAVHLRTTPSTIPQGDSSSFKSQPSLEVLRKITASIREEINPIKRDAMSPQDISSRVDESDGGNTPFTSDSSQEDSINYSIPDRALQNNEDEPLFAPTVEVSQASVPAAETVPEESPVSDEAEERLHTAMEANSSPKWTPPGLKKTPIVGHKRPDPESLNPRREKEPEKEEEHSSATVGLPLGRPPQDKPLQHGEIEHQDPPPEQTLNTRPEQPLMRALSPVQPLPEHSLPPESSNDIPLWDDFPATVHGINVAPTPSSMPPARLLSGPVFAVSLPIEEQQSASASSSEDSEAPRKVRKLSSYIDKQIAGSRADGTKTDNQAETTTRDQEPKAPPVKLIAFVAVAVVVVLVGTTITGWMIATSGVNWLSKSSTLDWKQLSQQADVAISNKSWSEAIDYLTKAISENPNLASLYHKRGLARLQLHDQQSGQLALADFDAAITKKSDLCEAYLDRAAAHIALGQYRQAIDDYNRLIKSGKDTSKVRFGLALAKYYSGEYSEAESGLRRILEDSPGNPEVVIALGTTIYKGQKNEIAAVNQYLSAQGPMKDSSGLALRNLAILAFEKGPSYYNEARKYYGDAIDISPGDANLFNERGILRWYQKEPIGAINDFKSALKREPDLSSAQDNLNFACNELIQRGRQKMKDQPKSHVGYALVAFGLSKLDRFKDALYYANEAIALNPRNAGSYEVLGTCYKELGLYEDAIAPLSVAISVSTTSGDAYGDRAYASYRSDHYPEALSDAEKAIQIDNTLTTPYTVRSVVLLSRGDYETALADNNRLVTLQPMNASNYSNRALTYIEGKRVKEAELDLRKSIALNPNHWHGFICLGSLMLDLGNHDEALNLLNKAVTIKPGQETYPTRIFFFETIRQLDNAISDCSKLLTANPYNEGNFRLRGTAYSLAGKFVEAQKDFDTALTLKEDDEGYSDRAASYLRQGELDKADQDVRKALTLNRNSAPALTRQALSSILQKDWNGAVMSADKIVKTKGWEDANSYAAVLLKWVALNYQGKTLLAREVLLNCKNNAENFPWPTPVVRFLLGEINFEQLKNESKNLGELTDAFYYGGMKDYFAGKKSEAKEKLRWVVSDGLMLNSEYLLARKSLEWMGAEGQTK